MFRIPQRFTVYNMCGGGTDDLPNYDLPNLSEFNWELFIQGLGDDFPQTATDNIPASIRTLFVAHAKKAGSAIADVWQELRRGESRQDDLMVELRTHRLQTFKAVQQVTAALKVEMATMTQQLDLMTAAARKSEEKVAMLIATLRKMQEDHVQFGNDLKDIGRKMDTNRSPLAVATLHTAAQTTTPEGVLTDDSCNIGPKRDTNRRLAVREDEVFPPDDRHRFGQMTGSAGAEEFIPPNVRTWFASATGHGDQQRHPLIPNVDPSTLHQVPADVKDDDTAPAPRDKPPAGIHSTPMSNSGWAECGDGGARSVPPLEKGRSPFRNSSMSWNPYSAQSFAGTHTQVDEHARDVRQGTGGLSHVPAMEDEE